MYVTPKLEYQPTFGVEQETISEIARNWISVYVRPTCSLLRGKEYFRSLNPGLKVSEPIHAERVVRICPNTYHSIGRFIRRQISDIFFFIFPWK